MELRSKRDFIRKRGKERHEIGSGEKFSESDETLAKRMIRDGIAEPYHDSEKKVVAPVDPKLTATRPKKEI